ADHIAPDWTLVAGVEQDYTAASFFSPISPAQMVLNYVATTTDSAAMWIERSWNSTWTAGLGARWSYESTTMSNYGLHGYGYHVPIPLAIVEWQPWKDQTFSLSYGTGYRSGGQINTGPATYVPERSRNFEFAWRAQWLDGKVHTALSAFEGEIHNRFTYYLTNTGGTLFASVRDRGIEFEITDDLSDAWRLRAGIGSLNSHFSSFIYQFGEPTAEAPPETATFGMRYGFERGWYGALDVYHAAAALYYSPSGRLPAYTAVSVGAGYRSKDWDTKLIVTNALDADFIERIELSAAYQTGYRLGDPRRIELRIKRNW
ncbi:MAG TPA: TonB-dependent receptor, partial [Rudaea sp.]|nr:TonB-dependent receptor [Rudaea sp.]